MTQDIDLTNMTTDKEIIPEFREELEVKIKDIFIWALGEAAVTEMTKTENFTLSRRETSFIAELISSVSLENRTKQRKMSGPEYYKRRRIVNLTK